MIILPIDDAKEIIQGALDDMRTSGKFRCQYNEIDGRIKCDGFGVRNAPLNGKSLRVCHTCIKVILSINPGLDSPKEHHPAKVIEPISYSAK
jgi:hypothetical protein